MPSVMDDHLDDVNDSIDVDHVDELHLPEFCLYFTLLGHSCKMGNMRCPGTLKNQNPQFEEKKYFFLLFYVSISHPRMKK